MTLPDEIKEIFFLTLFGDKTELEFERWLYQDKQLEHLLRPEDYLDFISHGYRNRAQTGFELVRLLEKHIHMGEYEKWRVLKLLNKALNRGTDLPGILIQFYDLYCTGYNFMSILGLQYGLAVAVPYGYALNWESITEKEQREIIQGFYPQLETEIHKVISWLEEDQIIFTGMQDGNGHFLFVDKRKIEADNFATVAIMQPCPGGSSGNDLDFNT